MYISFVRDIPEEYFFKNKDSFYDEIYLNSCEELNNIKEFISEFGIDKYKALFDFAGIKHSAVSDDGLSYIAENGMKLVLNLLSSVKRILLYSMVMSGLNKPIVISGLADRLDRAHRDLLMNNSDKLRTLIILAVERRPINQEIVNVFYKPFNEILDEGIL